MRYTMKFRLRDSRKNERLDETINLAGCAYNHIIALHKRWYRLFGRKNREANMIFLQTHGREPTKDEYRTTYISRYTMINHLTRLKKSKQFTWLKEIPSQALQQIAERVDEGYQRFFDAKNNKSRRKISPPSYKRVRTYRSFTLKQVGWKLLGKGHVRLNGVDYRFFESRPITGKIKTVTVVRDSIGHYYVCFSCEAEEGQSEICAATGKTAGMDFGLKTSWTIAAEDKDGNTSVNKITVPRALMNMLPKLRRANREFSKALLAHKKRREIALSEWKKKGGAKPNVPQSKRLIKARREQARVHQRIENMRSDWQWKLARELSLSYDVIYVEDLYFAGMARRKHWGRKLLDAAPGNFLWRLEFECKKNGSMLVRRPWNFASTQICHVCGHRLVGENKLGLRDREWTCPKCGTHHDRDENAAMNILKGEQAA